MFRFECFFAANPVRTDAVLIAMQCCRDIYGALSQLLRIEQKKNTVYLNAERYNAQLAECESLIDGVVLAVQWSIATMELEKQGLSPAPAHSHGHAHGGAGHDVHPQASDVVAKLLPHNPDALAFWSLFYEDKVRSDRLVCCCLFIVLLCSLRLLLSRSLLQCKFASTRRKN